MAVSREAFHKLLKSAVQNGVSDIHLRTNERPCFRIKGDLIPIKMEPLKPEDMIQLATFMIKDKSLHEKIPSLMELDGSFEIPKLCRVRYNLLRYQSKIGMILRLIEMEIPNTEKLGLPKVVNRISMASHGLVLVTGATGSGKSSTLAAMINHINQNKPVHILTLEDPIEFVHKSAKARITQREIGEDTANFGSALRSALRQDPDIILIGEMRDAETIGIALKAAETGHLVFGTVHTTNALNTVGRLISMFPPEEQDAVRARIADNLYATVSQRLLKTKDGKGRVAAQEIMITSPGIKEAINTPDKISEIYIYMEKGRSSHGTRSFDQHITELYKADKITIDEAKANASSPEDFERNLMFSDD